MSDRVKVITAEDLDRIGFEKLLEMIEGGWQGWIEGLPMENYIALPAMSSTGMQDCMVAPGYFWFRKSNPKAPTDLMVEGTAVHLRILEPHLFEGRYIAIGQCEKIMGNGNRCSNQGSVYRDGFSFCRVKGHDPLDGAPMAEGIEVMPEETLTRIDGMERAVLAHPEASRFFVRKGRSELTGIARCPETGVLLKVRLDRTIDHAEWIHTDLKVTGDASKKAFPKHAARMGYVSRAAFYRRVFGLLDWKVTASVLIAVEREPKIDRGSGPEHGCMTHLLDEGEIEIWSRAHSRHLRIHAECLQTGHWPGYDTGLSPMKSPPWELPEQPKGSVFGNEWEEAAEEEVFDGAY